VKDCPASDSLIHSEFTGPERFIPDEEFGEAFVPFARLFWWTGSGSSRVYHAAPVYTHGATGAAAAEPANATMEVYERSSGLKRCAKCWDLVVQNL